jgi:lipopolysaccharide export system protein LptC
VRVIVADKRLISVERTEIIGTDSRGQPYKIKARLSRRPDKDKTHINFKDVNGHLKREGGETVTFSSNKAYYNRSKKVIDLNQQVKIISKDRYKLTMPEARINLGTNELTSDSPVKATLNGGEIRSGGIKVSNDGKAVVFQNRVHATFGEDDDGSNDTTEEQQ